MVILVVTFDDLCGAFNDLNRSFDKLGGAFNDLMATLKITWDAHGLLTCDTLSSS